MPDIRDQLAASLGDSYTLERELGRGGMSRVFVAEERALGRHVVIKVLARGLAEGLSAERFAREVRLAANLQHPCIVPVLSANSAGGMPYYTMPLIAGDTLRARLDLGEPIPLPEAIKILGDIAAAMAYAHERGIVHRDIKPENVLLSGGYALVTDFGIAKAIDGAREITGDVDTTLTQFGTTIGTPAYMAPEQATGDAVDGRTDIYAWGVVAYELLDGHHPFGQNVTPRSMIMAHMSQVPPSLTEIRPSIPPALADLVARALAKEPASRPPNAAVLVDALAAGTGALPAAAPVTQPTPAVRRAQVKRTVVIGAGVVLVVATMASGTIRFLRQAAARGEASVAVLPFLNLSGDTSDVYFGDGMADELTTALAKVPRLRVASRSSSAALRGKTARMVHDALKVDNVLEGTVRRAGDKLRISAQLTNASNGLVLWSDVYDRSSANVFAVQDDIASSIVTALRTRFGGGPAPRSVVVAGTRNAEAHEAYMRGKYLFGKRGAENLTHARELLETATRLDPKYADAYAALATVFYALPDWIGMHPDTAARLGKAAALRALALDPNQADAHAALGALSIGRDNATATKEFALAVAADSTNPVVYHWRGLLEAGTGDLIAAARSLQRAHELDPLAAHIQWTYAMLLQCTGRVDEGQRQLEQLVATHPQHQEARASLAELYLAQGKRAAALAQLDSAKLEASPEQGGSTSFDMFGTAGYLRARSGDSVTARAYLAGIKRVQGADADGMGGFSQAKIWLGLGQVDSTFAAMARTATNSKMRLSFFAMDPAYGPLFSDPRWSQLYRHAGFDWVLRNR